MTTTAAAESTLLKRIQHVLGLQTLQSDQDLLMQVENRLPVEVLAALAKCGVTDDEIHRLVIPRRTLAHRKAKRQPLTREESDRVVRIARITALAEKVFADKTKASHWLHQPKRRFDARTPMELLATEAGARLVEEMLYQIDYALFS